MNSIPDATDALERIEMIRLSLASFTNGLIGLVPVVGFPQAVLAVVRSRRVRVRFRERWNPAERYRRWGFRLGVVGLLSTALIIVEILTLF
jgi:hypothetical protein